jgi:hypothetical protein
MGDVASFEPDLLRLGKAFDHRARVRYLGGLRDGTPAESRTMARSAGTARWDADGGEIVPVNRKRPGFADVLLDIPGDDDQLGWQVVIEIKNTDWDQRQTHRVRPNLARHARQLWGYLEPLLQGFDAGEAGAPQGALLYPRRPRTVGRADLIEEFLSERGLSVVYYDELDP